MKVKKVNQYQCDFCGKKNYSAGHMRKHEMRCTKNPNRECGYCNLMEEAPVNMSKLLILLPDPEKFKRVEHEFENFERISYPGLEEASNEALVKLREVASNCPACILAALRQKNIIVPLVTNFNFSDECQRVWSDFNADQMQGSF